MSRQQRTCARKLLVGQVPALPYDHLVQLSGPLVTAGAPLVIAQLGHSLDGPSGGGGIGINRHGINVFESGYQTGSRMGIG